MHGNAGPGGGTLYQDSAVAGVIRWKLSADDADDTDHTDLRSHLTKGDSARAVRFAASITAAKFPIDLNPGAGERSFHGRFINCAPKLPH